MKSARTLAVVTVSIATLARGLFGAPLAAAIPTVSDIKITSSADKASATLSRKAGGSQQEFLKIELTEAIVTRDASTGMATGKRAVEAGLHQDDRAGCTRL
jgi:type VI protein secretion system component Hcp